MSAPFHAHVAEAPEAGTVVWRTAKDGVQLRIGLWSVSQPRGTVLLLPGRTEYIEKYGRVISDITAHGYAVAVIDWRGQGYSDRLANDSALGHVGAFSDYQHDLFELIGAVKDAGLPQHLFLLAHSLGGNIGLRALINGLDVKRAVFSAPMWGILIPARKRLTALMLPTLARASGRTLRYLPGSRKGAYLIDNGFEDNLLTSDKYHFEYLVRQLSAVPQLVLGGPSIHWFGQAQAECARLIKAHRPDIPVRTFVGTQEGIVDPAAILAMHQNWPSAALTKIKSARHELMMEREPARQEFLENTLAFFDDDVLD